MTFDRDAYREDREAELGYTYASEREVKLREWQDTREDAEFEALCRRLLAKRGNAKQRERVRTDPAYRAIHREWQRKWATSPRGRASLRKALLAWRARERAKRRGDVLVCAECGATWCRISQGGRRPKWCSDACQQRARYQRVTPGARRVSRRGVKRARAIRTRAVLAGLARGGSR